MRALFALVVWLASLAAAVGGTGFHMVAEDDGIDLPDMRAPPWRASAHEQATSDHAGFEPCEQVVKLVVSRGLGNIIRQTYTTSPRWGKILRTEIAMRGGSSTTLATCWVDAKGGAQIVMKVDDGEP